MMEGDGKSISQTNQDTTEPRIDSKDVGQARENITPPDVRNDETETTEVKNEPSVDNQNDNSEDSEGSSSDTPVDDFPEDAFIDSDEEKQMETANEKPLIAINDNNTDSKQHENTSDDIPDEKGDQQKSPFKEEPSIDLNVELPSKEGGAVADVPKENDHLQGAGASNNMQESIYHVKWISFKNNKLPIITQNENGPCPLLAIINVLLLQKRISLPLQTEVISVNQLMTHLGDCVLQNVPGEEGVSTPSRLNFEQNMGDAMEVMYKLQTGLDVNVKFTGVRDFEYTQECIIFDLLQIALFHGWLVDPQNKSESEAVGKYSYNQLVERIINLKSSDQPELVSQALVAESFLENSASQLTYHGLSELATQLKNDDLVVLFRNNHFTTLYRTKEELLQLVTDQGFLHESNVVWETLGNVDGDCHFVDSNFHTFTKPEPPPLKMDPSNVPFNSEEQIDQDYLVALSLQQEQQSSEQPQQQGWTNPAPHLSDEELAKHLQAEEEQRAAAAAAAAAESGRRQGQRPPAQNLPRRQQRSREEREEKKDGCCIL
ncbi:ubiquitin carboxyl-terminal hydrolase MINDY-2-like [Mya arenaria]|uniref:ubiquitin carboxyl-terminal hydrolase MINDY-2-like n=1 Tax=Mya arenaria TaxID=6604 RepID=UPI0022E68B0A|nr:ubiquitin carboxyl-terminal hydrolase MINDY-2-like [Mya arenaria]